MIFRNLLGGRHVLCVFEFVLNTLGQGVGVEV